VLLQSAVLSAAVSNEYVLAVGSETVRVSNVVRYQTSKYLSKLVPVLNENLYFTILLRLSERLAG